MANSIFWHFVKVFFFATLFVGGVYGLAAAVVAPSIQAIGNQSQVRLAP